MQVYRSGQWIIAGFPCGIDSWAWERVALVDRLTGAAFSVVPWLSNADAARLAARAERGEG